MARVRWVPRGRGSAHSGAASGVAPERGRVASWLVIGAGVVLAIVLTGVVVLANDDEGAERPGRRNLAAVSSETSPSVPSSSSSPAVTVPSGIELCRADQLEYAGGARSGLLRFFNRAGGPCGLVGPPTLLGKQQDGSWRAIPTRPQNGSPVSASAPWTGVFEVSKAAVVFIRPGNETSAAQCTGQQLGMSQFFGLRVVLPAGAGVVDIPDAGTFDLGPCPPHLSAFGYDTTSG